MSKIRAITPVNIVTKRNIPSYVAIVITSLSGASRRSVWCAAVILAYFVVFVNIYENAWQKRSMGVYYSYKGSAPTSGCPGLVFRFEKNRRLCRGAVFFVLPYLRLPSVMICKIREITEVSIVTNINKSEYVTMLPAPFLKGTTACRVAHCVYFSIFCILCQYLWKCLTKMVYWCILCI